MNKIVEIELECPIRDQMDDFAHLGEIGRVSVRCQTHDLVLVAVIGKAEIVGQSLVKNSERVRKINPPRDLDVGAAADAPGCACEIAETVDRDDGRLGERRHVESR